MSFPFNGTAASSQSQNATDAQPASPIDTAVLDLTNSQYRTNDLLGLLESRLHSVLKPQPPQPDTAKPSSVIYSPLHQQLQEAGERAYLLNTRLNDIIDRLVVG